MRGIRPEIVNLPNQQINEVASLALGDPNVIPLWFGESDLLTPAFIRKAAQQALDDGRTFYDQPGGIAPLRRALKAYMDRVHGTDIALSRVILPGAAMLAIAMAVTALAGQGDNVVVIGPVWPNIVFSIQTRGAQPRFVLLDQDQGRFSLDLAKVAAAIDDRTRAVFVNSPNNPTGWIMPADQQQALLDLTRARGIGLIADEVYNRIVYDAPAAPSFLSLARGDDLVFVINSFSKTYAMTGWRLGWMTAPEPIAGRLHVMSGIENTGATVFAQYGALAAIEGGEDFLAEMVARCAKGRDLVEAKLSQHPKIIWRRPQGAFYAYFGVEGLSDPLGLAKRLVKEAGVGLAPGTAFGPGQANNLRLCFAQSPERLAQGLDRLVQGLERIAVT